MPWPKTNIAPMAPIATTTTDGSGHYRFDQQNGASQTGNYAVSVVVPAGYHLTTASTSRTFLISRGDVNVNVDFGTPDRDRNSRPSVKTVRPSARIFFAALPGGNAVMISSAAGGSSVIPGRTPRLLDLADAKPVI